MLVAFRSLPIRAMRQKAGSGRTWSSRHAGAHNVQQTQTGDASRRVSATIGRVCDVGFNNTTNSGAVSARVAAGGSAVELLRDGKVLKQLHPLWLRERTQHPEMLHVESAQRLFECANLLDKEAARVDKADVLDEGRTLNVHFRDGLSDSFSVEELTNELQNQWVMSTRFASGPSVYDQRIPVDLGFPQAKYWGADLDGVFELSQVIHPYAAVSGSDQGKTAFLDSLLTYGVAVVQDTPVEHDRYIQLLKSFGKLRMTNWGEWFEVVAKPPVPLDDSGEDESVVDAANSNLGIPLHVDGPYNENPLLFQVLQCLKQSKVGGESTLSDGLGAARSLRRRDPQAYALLCNTKVRFRYHDASYDLLTERPMICVDPVTQEPDRIFFSGRLDASPALDTVADMEVFYRAKAAFLAELHRPDRLLTFKLRERDMLVMSNTRLVHGRSAFSTDVQDEEAGADAAQGQRREIAAVARKDGLDLDAVARHLRGCYMEGIDSKYRVTKRRIAAAQRAAAGGARGLCSSPSPSARADACSEAAAAREVVHSPTAGLCAFSHLKDITEGDLAVMTELYQGATSGAKLADRALGLLKLLNRVHAPAVLGLDDTHLGCKIDLYEHGLQTASRCLEAGCDEEVVVAGLLHDIGELLSPCNHGEVAAALLRPFVSPHVSWMLAHHEVFQMKYYQFNDRERRQVYNTKDNGAVRTVMGVTVPKDVDFFEFTADFCERFDQQSFDPNYSSCDISRFEPMVRRVFEREPFWHTPGHPKKGAVTGV